MLSDYRGRSDILIIFGKQIEGLLTCVLGLGSYVLLVDFPDKAPKSWKFLNQTEVSFIITTIERDRADTTVEPFSLQKYLANGKDSTVWAYAILYMLVTMPSYAIAYFLPVILYSLTHSPCLSPCRLISHSIPGTLPTVSRSLSPWRSLVSPIILSQSITIGKTFRKRSTCILDTPNTEGFLLITIKT